MLLDRRLRMFWLVALTGQTWLTDFSAQCGNERLALHHFDGQADPQRVFVAQRMGTFRYPADISSRRHLDVRPTGASRSCLPLRPEADFASQTPEREQLVQQLSQATKLTPAAALDCLRANNWDPANAMANFEALKAGGSLPASAFMS